MACSGRPREIIDSTDALPPIGRTLDDFQFPIRKEDRNPDAPQERLSNHSLKGRTTVAALWNALTPGNEPAMEEFDQLAEAYRREKGIRFVVIADHSLGGFLDSVLKTVPWKNHVDVIASGWRWMPTIFDRRGFSPRRPGVRPEFRMPSFLVLAADGKVIARVAGRPYEALNPVLDSLPVSAALVQAAGDNAFVEQIRPRIVHALSAFDAATLTVPDDSAFTLYGSCNANEPSPYAVIPALGRVLSVGGGAQRISVRLELVTVADAEVPTVGDDLCAARAVDLAVRVRRDTFDVRFEEVTASDGSNVWQLSGPLRRISQDSLGRDQVSLFPLAQAPARALRPRASLRAMAARVDSIRQAETAGQ